MTREELEAAAGRLVDAVNRHDPEGIAALYVEDGISRDVGRDMALMGRSQIRESMRVYFDAFPDLAWTPRRFSCDGNVAYLEWHGTMTHTGPYHGVAPTGRQVEVDGCSVLVLGESGSIVSGHIYWDVASLLRQLGLMPTWDSEQATAS